jgi:pimeloyl-ACP methyl ester carboxylesterase
VGDVRYATTVDGLSIAYVVDGDGPFDVVYVPGTTSHVELMREIPSFRYMFDRLSRSCRLIRLDKRGSGLSDRDMGSGLPEQRMDDIRAVMDAVGVRDAVILGVSEGGSLAAMFAALHPHRVSRLILLNAMAYGPLCAEHPLRERAQRAAEEILAQLAREWGTGRAISRWIEGIPDLELAARQERYSCTPAGLVSGMRANMHIDVRPILDSIRAPTLVIYSRNDRIIPARSGPEFAARIPGATLVPVDGGHAHYDARAFEPIVLAIEAWLTGQTAAVEADSSRVLTTVLFTDIVNSTGQAQARGDTSWAGVLDRHDRLTQGAVERFRGQVIKSTGDGMLATFDGPGRALDCALAISSNVEALGLQIRGGVHTGEVEVRPDGDIGGIAVHIASRIAAAAADGEIWASPTVPGLVVGSAHEFQPRGEHYLKGVDGEWRLASVSK